MEISKDSVALKQVSAEELLKEYAKGRRDFSGVEFEKGMDLERAKLKGVIFNGADLGGANLYGADLEGAHFEYADCCGVNLEVADLQGANFRYALLNDAKLKNADLEKANFRMAELEDANLSGAYLMNADFVGANLKYTNFRNANLIDADGLVCKDNTNNIEYAIFEHTHVTEEQNDSITAAILQGKFDVIKLRK